MKGSVGYTASHASNSPVFEIFVNPIDRSLAQCCASSSKTEIRPSPISRFNALTEGMSDFVPGSARVLGTGIQMNWEMLSVSNS